MKKTFIKVLIATMTLTSTLGIGNLVKAATADQLYSNAYNAITTAIIQKTQTSINNARTAIEDLRGTAASFAIGEFSKQVDQVQQPILVTICNAINVIQDQDRTGNYSENDITTAHNSIPSNLPDVWRSSYSSAVDIVQQHYQQKAVDAWALFHKTGVRSDHDAAMELFRDIGTYTWDTATYQAWANAVIYGE